MKFIRICVHIRSTDLAMGNPVLASNVDRVKIINVTYKHLYSHGYIALGKR